MCWNLYFSHFDFHSFLLSFLSESLLKGYSKSIKKKKYTFLNQYKEKRGWGGGGNYPLVSTVMDFI